MTLKQLKTRLQDAKDAVDTLLNGGSNESEHALAVSHLRSLLPRYEDHLAIGEGVRSLLDKLDEQDAAPPEMAGRDRLCYYSKR